MKTWIVSKRDKIKYIVIADNALLALSYLSDFTKEAFSLDDIRSGADKDIFKIK